MEERKGRRSSLQERGRHGKALHCDPLCCLQVRVVQHGPHGGRQDVLTLADELVCGRA